MSMLTAPYAELLRAGVVFAGGGAVMLAAGWTRGRLARGDQLSCGAPLPGSRFGGRATLAGACGLVLALVCLVLAWRSAP